VTRFAPPLSAPPPRAPIPAPHPLHARTALELGQKAAAKAPAALLEADPPPPPDIDFGTDFSTHEESIMLINQGGKASTGGDFCCDSSRPGQCQIQLSHLSGERYFDLSNQRDRFEDSISGETSIDFYSLGKSIIVNVTDGQETCQEYCPIPDGDKMEKFNPFDPLDTVHDLGSEGGLEHYQWSDIILKVIKMQTTDLYVDQSASPAVPVRQSSKLTPFGQAQIGSQNQTWSSWKAGKQSADKFKIAGLDACPMSNKCSSPQMQHHRLRTRRLRDFWAHEELLSNDHVHRGILGR
jgi:hypothetical protein